VIVPKRPGFPADEGNPFHEPLFRLAVSPAVLDPVGQVLGPDIIMFTAFMIAKPKGAGAEMPWHQDIIRPIGRSTAYRCGLRSTMSIRAMAVSVSCPDRTSMG